MKYASKKSAPLAVGFLALGILFPALAGNAAPGTPIDFKTTVLPILKNSCFACHVSGTQVTLPSNPMLAQKAQRAIDRASDKFPLGTSFPFPGDDSAVKQIHFLQKSISKGFMPPKFQAKFGLGAPLSDQDRKTLLSWVAQLQGAQK